MTILVTGFEPFGDFTLNPSARVAELLHETTVAGQAVHGLVLPVARDKAPRILEEAVRRLQPEIVLPLGLAGSRASLAMERVAINVLDFSLPDNTGLHPVDEPVVEGGPPAYFATLPIKRTVVAWKGAGIPGYVSNTAGTYLCNQIMYEALHLGESYGFRSGFIHLPCLPESISRPTVPSMALDLMVTGVRIALEVAVEAEIDVPVAAGAVS